MIRFLYQLKRTNASKNDLRQIKPLISLILQEVCLKLCSSLLGMKAWMSTASEISHLWR